MKQTSGTFECVRYYDPAIDYPDDDGTASMEYAQYRDIKSLTFVDESIAKPMIFVCRRLTQSQRKIVGSAPHESEAYRRAFAYGVVAVKNYQTDSGDYITWEPRRKDDDAMMSNARLDDFGEDDIMEIGSVVRGQSFLARGVPLRLLPLGSSQVAYLAVRRLFAERKRVSKTQTDG